MGVKLSGGGEGGQYALNQNADLNVTPFVDVLLVLIIVFMLAVPLATVSIKLDLPPPGGEAPTKLPLLVNVEAGGHVFLGGREVALRNLDGEISKGIASSQADPDHVAIRAGRDVRYQEFLSVLNTLQAGGYDKVGLVMESLT